MEDKISVLEQRKRRKIEIIRTVLVNAVAPYVIYMLLKSRTSEFDALIFASIPPLLESLWSIVCRRRVDVSAGLIIAGLGLSLLLIALGGGPRLLLIRESFITGLIGLLFLASLAVSRPIIFYIARETAVGGALSRDDWHSRWQRPPFRRMMRMLTIVWGVGLVVEAAVRITMVETLSISDFLLVSPFVQFGLTALLVAATVRYVRHARKNSVGGVETG